MLNITQENSTPVKNLGELLLSEANRVVATDRQAVYGHPNTDFTKTAGILTSLGFNFRGEPLNATHIPIMMIAVKLSRLVNNTDCWHADSYIDIAGYVKTAGLVKEARDIKKATTTDCENCSSC